MDSMSRSRVDIEPKMGRVEQPGEVAFEVELHGLAGGPAHFVDAAFFDIPAADDVLFVEKVDRDLDKDRTWYTRVAMSIALSIVGPSAENLGHPSVPLRHGLHQAHLIDVLKRASSLQDRRRGAAEHKDG